jgi:hypothetical protein
MLLNRRYLLAAAISAFAIALLLGIPTAVVDNPWFTRMTPVAPEQYVFWALSSVLGGALLGTYLLPELRASSAGSLVGSSLLGVFAVGCPTCNAPAVAVLGTSGALNVFASVQPLIGVAAVGVAGWALWIRLRSLRPDCPVA